MVLSRIILVSLTLLLFTNLKSQCIDCEVLNLNGDFELTNYAPGAENNMGLSMGKIQNWYSTHGTSDYFDPNWNWYGAEGIEDNAAHICYGNRPSHDHSEGIYTEVEILDDEDLTYCLSFDYATFSDTDKPGKLHLYFANNLYSGPSFDFTFPTIDNKPEWFEGSQKIDIIALEESSDYKKHGWSNYQINIKPRNNYKQFWLFSEYMYNDNLNANCGVMFDYVELRAETDAITDITVNQTADNLFALDFEVYVNLRITNYEWYVNGQLVSNDARPLLELPSNTYEIELRIKDERSACGYFKKSINLSQQEDQSQCDYSLCLDAGGVPQIQSIKMYADDIELVLDANTQGLSFPYCIGSWSMCSSKNTELEYLIDDLNFWLEDKGFNCRAEKGTDNTLNDGCRTNMIHIKSSKLSFVSMQLGDQRDPTKTQNYFFQTSDCFKVNDLAQIDDIIDIELGPNPTTDHLTVSFKDSYDNVNVSVVDFTGNIVLNKKIGQADIGTSNRLNLNGLESGVYVVNIDASQMRESRRFVIN